MPNINLVLLLKILGWVFISIPVLVFIYVGITIIKGLIEDDSAVKTFVMIFMALFITGVILLLSTYVLNIVPHI